MLNFENHPASQEVPHFEGFEGPADEILGQLVASEDHYNEALEKLREGNLDDLEYLQEMRKNLVSFSNKFTKELERVSEKNRGIHGQVLARLNELNSVLETMKQ
jgi:hypothetical protein